MYQTQRDAGQGRRCRPSGPSLSVEVEFLHAPDAQERLARAFDLILRTAARAEVEPTTDATDDQETAHDDH
ncbi:MAG: hypothetical protein Q8O40_16430 [Chloroflexota bacterium]|nr:hypothetical protein [Chloroflexota bacterium]